MAKRKSDELAARMAATRPAEPAPAFQKAPKAFPHRVTLDLTEDQHQALALAAVKAGRGVTMAGILRELVDRYVIGQPELPGVGQ